MGYLHVPDEYPKKFDNIWTDMGVSVRGKLIAIKQVEKSVLRPLH